MEDFSLFFFWAIIGVCVSLILFLKWVYVYFGESLRASSLNFRVFFFFFFLVGILGSFLFCFGMWIRTEAKLKLFAFSIFF